MKHWLAERSRKLAVVLRMLRVEENNDLAPALGEPDLLDFAGGAAAAVAK
jgi:hypothetical protein